jgi:hypothetical protein
LYAAALSATGTAITIAVLTKSLEVVTVLDELVVPVLAVFTTTLEVVGFAFIYGENLNLGISIVNRPNCSAKNYSPDVFLT